MKFKLLATVFVAVALLSSCLDKNESAATPYIQMANYPVTTGGDSLNVFYTENSATWLMDTVSVGDTVKFSTLLVGWDNNLTSFNMSTSIDSVAKLILPPADSLNIVFGADSDYAAGKYIFVKQVNLLMFSFRYVALKPSKDAAIYMSLTSDAKFDMPGANTTVRSIKTPIKE